LRLKFNQIFLTGLTQKAPKRTEMKRNLGPDQLNIVIIHSLKL